MNKHFNFIGCFAVVVLAFLGGVFLVENNKELVSLELEKPFVERAVTGTAKLYGKVLSVDSKSVAARIALVEWVQGADNQEQAAIEAGSCTLASAEKDECLPNPFFVRETKKELTIPFSSTAIFKVYDRPQNEDGFLSDDEGNLLQKNVGVTEFVAMLKKYGSLKSVPFVVITKNGAIVEMQEQYIP